MSTAENFTIKSGLPFSKEIVITLPNGRSWWTSTSDFEVLMQIRKDKDRNSALVMDLSEFLTVTMRDTNTVDVKLVMTGADTRDLTEGGAYDMLISDSGVTDARAIEILAGSVKRTTVVTAEAVDLP